MGRDDTGVGEESQEAKVAVAVNDIEWLKESQRSTNRGIDQLQTTLSQYMKEQNDRSEKFATKDELNAVRSDVDKLKKWRWQVGGAIAVIAVLLGLGEAAIRVLKG